MITDKKKILQLLWSGGIGGTEEYITSLSRYFNPLEYEVHVWFLHEKGLIFDDAIKMGLNVDFIGIKKGFDFTGGIKLFKCLYREKFDIIHVHTPNILTNITVSLFRKTGKIFTEHVSPGASRLLKRRKLFYYLFSNSYQKIIAISEVVKQKIIEKMRIDPRSITVIHDGVQTEKYNDSVLPPHDLKHLKQNNKHIVGFIGRMVDFKRPALFVEIAAELIKEKRNFYFIMVGDGPELEKCQGLIHDYKIEEYFKLLGFRRDIPNILTLFDSLLFTSTGEGFGIVLLEAMAMGIPVFAFNDGAVPEIIKNKINGILLDTITPRDISQYILKCIEDQDLMTRIKKKEMEDAHSKFSIHGCVQNIENIYREVLNNART